jgi:hypothetical protein
MATVGNVVKARGCDTGVIRGLSLQIIDEMNLLIPNVLVSIDDLDITSGNDAALNLFMQPRAKEALKRAIKRRGVPIRLNSVYRTVAQQHLLFSWQGSCGITIAATPGKSNHEDGFALDTPDASAWQSALEAEKWDFFGPGDPVHFTYIGGGVRDDVGDIGVKAFQTLWNKHNPGDQIKVDGGYGSTTADRLNRSPAEGFGGIRILKLTDPNMEGDDVTKVQQVLVAQGILAADQVDGFYGPKTEQAVKTFQIRAGLSPDGQTGPSTRKALKITA